MKNMLVASALSLALNTAVAAADTLPKPANNMSAETTNSKIIFFCEEGGNSAKVTAERGSLTSQWVIDGQPLQDKMLAWNALGIIGVNKSVVSHLNYAQKVCDSWKNPKKPTPQHTLRKFIV
jgi:hypothetical protein